MTFSVCGSGSAYIDIVAMMPKRFQLETDLANSGASLPEEYTVKINVLISQVIVAIDVCALCTSGDSPLSQRSLLPCNVKTSVS